MPYALCPMPYALCPMHVGYLMLLRKAINLFMINFQWYRSLIEVYRAGTVSGAAQVFHLTQPAVSQHVAARESALGNLLFQRTPRRMVPTEAGQRLYTEIAGARRNSNQFRTKTQPPKLHKPSESVRPIIFYRSTSRSITTGRSHFLHCTIWVNSRVNPTTQSRKARHCNCYKKNYLV